jgi:hypothetical protein
MRIYRDSSGWGAVPLLLGAIVLILFGYLLFGNYSGTPAGRDTSAKNDRPVTTPGPSTTPATPPATPQK